MFTPNWMEYLTTEQWNRMEREVSKGLPNPICGFIKNGIFTQVKNASRDPKFAVHDPNRNYSDVDAMVFSAYANHPSKAQLQAQIDSDVPWIMYPLFGSQAQPPIAWGDQLPMEPIIGRQYVYGVNDCWTIVRDIYKHDLGIELPRVATTVNWWVRGESEYMKHKDSIGFIKVDNPQPHDVVAFKYESRTMNHIGVMVDDNEFIHHMGKSLSTKAKLVNDGRDEWRPYVVGFYRHESMV